jgi:hypothetical protein
MRALMSEHGRLRVDAVTALAEALALLRALGVDAAAWCDAHPGHAAFWPCAEALGLRERVRVLAPATER